MLSVEERPCRTLLRSRGRYPQHPADAAAGVVLLHPVVSVDPTTPRSDDAHVPVPFRDPSLAPAELLGLGDIPQPVPSYLPNELSHAVPGALLGLGLGRISETRSGVFGDFCPARSLPPAPPSDPTVPHRQRRGTEWKRLVPQ